MTRAPLTNLATHPSAHVTPRELARYLECDPRTILRMIEGGTISAYRVGRNWRIHTDEARRVFPVHNGHPVASPYLLGTAALSRPDRAAHPVIGHMPEADGD